MFSSARKVAVGVALLLILSGGLLAVVQYNSLRSARTTDGTVTDAEMDQYESPVGIRVNSSSVYYRPDVTYQYTVDGVTYTSETVTFGTEIDTNSRTRAASVLSKFENGSAVTVYYDPADPSQSYLLPRIDFLPAGGLVVVGLLLLADALTPWSRLARVALSQVPLSLRTSDRFSAEHPNPVGPENPTAILEARDRIDTPRTAPLWGTTASAVWLACGLGIVATALAYFLVSTPPYDVTAYGVLAVPVFLNAKILVGTARS